MDISKDAIELSKERLENPIKSESALLKKGIDSYQNQSPEIAEYLKKINAYPVQRNKGIDGFMRDGDDIKPVPIKIQRHGESIKDAQDSLLKACIKNDFQTKILISTETNEDSFLEEDNLYIFNKSNLKIEQLTNLI